MKRMFFFLLFLPVFYQVYGGQFIYYPKEVYQGEPLKIVLFSSDTIVNVSASVEKDEKRILFADGFIFVLNSEDEVGIVLLGIPSNIRSGLYDLVVAGSTVEGDFSIKEAVNIIERSFLYEEIALNISLSELRRSSDPEKLKQSQELYNLLNTFNKYSIYNEISFSFPVLNYRISSYYGDRRMFLYNDGESARSIHNGVDLAAPVGTPVYSGGAGRVVFADSRILTGNSIVIEHLPGVYSIFFHLDKIFVNSDDLVEEYDQIGTIGKSGLATGAHLHWEIRLAGIPVDPVFLIEEKLIDKDDIISIMNLDLN